jgi:ubiquinone/menaquinone biosynthesis C-methylase UbiE
MEKQYPCKIEPEDFVGPHGYYPNRVELKKGFAHATGLPTGTIDLVLSRSVLEHIRNIPEILREQYRILRSGGHILHIVDLRDHLFKYPFEMLTFSRHTWERILTNPRHGSGYQNRLRVDDYMEMLRDAGFKDIGFESLGRDSRGFQKIKPKVHTDFRSKNDETMSFVIIALWAQK